MGAAILDRLWANGDARSFSNVDLQPGPNVNYPVQWYPCDLSNEGQIVQVCKEIHQDHEPFGSVDVLINCAGINEINYLEDLTSEAWDKIIAVNTKSAFLMAKNLLPSLKKSRGTILNIISNASHMPMTSSLAYNASKGALHIMTLQMARELTRRHGITVFGISPNKMSGTKMSQYIDKRVCEVRGWTEEEATKYQLSSLLAGEETDPETLAHFIAYLLAHKVNHKYLTGCVIPYGA